MGFLTPTLNGRNLTVDYVMKYPTKITDRIAELAGDQIVLDKIFHTLGQPVTGGAMLYNRVTAADFFRADDVKQRGPGDEYEIVRGVDPTPLTAALEDWGGKFPVPDEAISRNDAEYLSDQTTQLSNTIVEKLNTRALAVLEAQAGFSQNTVSGHDWMNAVTIGPEANLSEGGELPAADLAAVIMAGKNERLGVTYDTLLVNPQEEYSLRVAYGDKLEALLASMGLTMFAYVHVTPGTAWIMARGQVGIVGFEQPLKTETWREPRNRTSWVQSYAVPAMAVNKPSYCKKLTGLAG